MAERIVRTSQRPLAFLAPGSKPFLDTNALRVVEQAGGVEENLLVSIFVHSSSPPRNVASLHSTSGCLSRSSALLTRVLMVPMGSPDLSAISL